MAAAPLVSRNAVSDAFDLELGAAIALMGIIYLVGIVYDRYADTLVQDLDGHNRLWMGISGRSRGAPGEDPFPENRFRIEVLRSSGAADYSDYLKSRIRLTRALATLCPALSMAALILLIDDVEPDEDVRVVATCVVGVAYSVAFIVKQAPWKWLRGYETPRTDALLEPAVYESYVNAFGEAEEDPVSGPVAWKVLLNERLVWLAFTVAISESIIAVYFHHSDLLFVPLVGLLGALLSGWTWWRIFRTFLGLLRDVSSFR